jgi:acetyl-CoA acetyltransferase
MGGELREVYFVDGVRTAFGRAGPKGVFWRTRADDMAVKATRELLRRNPKLDPERIGDFIFAATAHGPHPMGDDVDFNPRFISERRTSTRAC